MDRYKKNMTSGPLHLATVGPRAPAFSFGLILFSLVSLFDWFWPSLKENPQNGKTQPPTYPSICEINVIFCHVPTGRKNRADFDQYIYIIGSNSDIWMVSRNLIGCCELPVCLLLAKGGNRKWGGQPIFETNVQVIPNLWTVSQYDQTVHSCASYAIMLSLSVNLVG